MKKKNSLQLFIISLLVLLACSCLIKGVDTSWGAVDVKTASSVSAHGYEMSYKVYIPNSATADKKAPAIIYMVGGGSSMDEGSTIGIEGSRRGYVVITVDVPGNGLSEPVVGTKGGMTGSDNNIVPINSIAEGLAYTSKAVEIVQSLECVDSTKLVMAGHSMGGYYSAIAAQSYADDVVLMLAEGTYGYSGDLKKSTKFNFGLIIGQGDENVISRTTGARTLSECIQSDGLKQMFGVASGQTLEVGKIYGDFASETARVVYTPNTAHFMEPVSPTVTNLFLSILTQATVAPTNLDSSNMVYWIKDILMLVLYVNMALMIFALAGMLLETPVFAGLKLDYEQKYIGWQKKSGKWIAAVIILMVICGAVYIKSYQFYTVVPLVKKLGNAGGKSLWAVGTAILLAVYLLVFKFTQGKKSEAKLTDYGLATSTTGKFSWLYLGKALLFAVTEFAIIYSIFKFYTAFTNSNIHFVFLNSEITAIEKTKAQYYFIPIMLCQACFIFANSIAQKTIAGGATLEDGKSWKKEMFFTSLVGTAAMIVLFIIFVVALVGPHVILFTFNRGQFGAESLLGMAAGFWMINVGCYYLNKKTGSIWTGVFTASMIMTWFLISASGMIF